MANFSGGIVLEKIVFENGNTQNPINDTNLNKMQENIQKAINEMLDKCYPIGRTIMDEDVNNDYSNYLGFTWSKTLRGVSPVGLNEEDEDQTYSTLGNEFGARTHSLTKDELPKINGSFQMHGAAASTNISNVTGDFTSNLVNSEYKNGGTVGTATSYGNVILDIGNNKEFNLSPPSKIVAFWKRVS